MAGDRQEAHNVPPGVRREPGISGMRFDEMELLLSS